MVIKMLTELGRRMMNTVRTSAKRKYKKISNRNHRTEEYNK